MGKWSCHCGYLMNDHVVPNPYGYSVYSDHLFDEIVSKTDEQNKIHYYDFSDASFYMWKCPKCSGFMAFDDDDNPNVYTFYQKYTPFDSRNTREMACKLMNTGIIFDVTRNHLQVNEKDICDIFKVPLGYCWFEINDVPIRMEVSKGTHEQDWCLKPFQVLCSRFDRLTLCSSFDVGQDHQIDILNHKYSNENRWQYKGLHLGITRNNSQILENEIKINWHSDIPYYASISDTRKKHNFYYVIWRQYVSHEVSLNLTII